MLEDEDFITHDDTHQRDHTEYSRQSQHTVHGPQSEQHTREGKADGGNADESNAETLEVEQDKEEYNQRGHQHANHNLRNQFAIGFHDTADFGADSMRNLEVIVDEFLNTAFHL